MSGIKQKKRLKRKPGRSMRHGGYSLIHRDQLIKEHPRLKMYLEDSRAGLIEDVAGSEDALSEQQRVMIDRIISRLSICRLIEIYCERYGVFRRDQIKRHKVLELEPALGINYLAFSNSIDRALVALGLNKKRADNVLDLGRYIAEKDAEADAKAKSAAKSRKQSQPVQAIRQGGDGDVRDQGSQGREIDDPSASRSETLGQGDPGTREEQD